MCLIFSSNLKGVASDWFYFLLPRSLHNFEEISLAFLTLYVSRWEAKKKKHHSSQNEKEREPQVVHQLLSEPAAKILNYGKDVFALTFINGLQISHPQYKHLLNHDVTWMSDVLFRIQSYILLEEAMKSSPNLSLKRDNDEK